MTKKLIYAGLALLALCFLLPGCNDDDECPVSPTSEDSASTVILGNVTLHPYLDFQANIHPIYGQENEIDSVFIGDSLCSIQEVPYYSVAGGYNYQATYSNFADSERFESGDLVDVRIYANAQSTELTVKLLSLTDTIDFISPPADTTISPGDPAEICWHKVDNADWYGMAIWWEGVDTVLTYDVAVFTTDTCYTLVGERHPVVGNYMFYVVAVSGPVPGTAAEVWDGTSLTGAVYSSGEVMWRSLVVSAPVITKATTAGSEQNLSARQKLTALEIIEGVLRNRR